MSKQLESNKIVNQFTYTNLLKVNIIIIIYAMVIEGLVVLL